MPDDLIERVANVRRAAKKLPVIALQRVRHHPLFGRFVESRVFEADAERVEAAAVLILRQAAEKRQNRVRRSRSSPRARRRAAGA